MAKCKTVRMQNAQDPTSSKNGSKSGKNTGSGAVAGTGKKANKRSGTVTGAGSHPERTALAKNRRASHEYEILKKFEAGIVLTGTEVRSLRENNCQLTDAFALVRNGEVWLHNLHIAPFSNGGIFNHEPERKRKLLLHKKQIRELERSVSERGMALVPLEIYFDENSRVKVEIAISRGKKLHDKRRAMADRDSKREIERTIKMRNR